MYRRPLRLTSNGVENRRSVGSLNIVLETELYNNFAEFSTRLIRVNTFPNNSCGLYNFNQTFSSILHSLYHFSLKTASTCILLHLSHLIFLYLFDNIRYYVRIVRI